MTVLLGDAQLQSEPATCLVVTLRRFQALIVAMETTKVTSAGSS
jgi:hypothetical protein